MTHSAALRAVAAALVAAPLFAACSGMLTEDGIGTAPTTTTASSANANFIRYAAIGTSISAGIQSGGINDSTQREAFTAQLAAGMGLRPGSDWFYPSFRMPGCPAPFTNPVTGTRVAGGSATGCLARDPASVRPFVSNVGIPFLRAAQALDLTVVPFKTDTLKLAQFITGSVSPITAVTRINPTFVTVEVGSNDVLHAATQGDTTLLTTVASFTASITAIADSLDFLDPEPGVAMMNIANVVSIPHMTRASDLWGLKTVTCPTLPPAVQATIPYCSPLFFPSASCAPAAAAGVGDGYLIPFPSTGALTSVLAAARAVSITCGGRDSLLFAAAATPTVPNQPALCQVRPAPAPLEACQILNTVEYPVVTARVTALNAAIAALVTARGYALVNANTALAAIPYCATATQTTPACIPRIPNFPPPGTAPNLLFGPVFSLDGVHPNKAGHRILAQVFAAAINTTYGTTIAVP